MLLACILYGGYLYPPNSLLTDVPWVGWIAVRYPIIIRCCLLMLPVCYPSALRFRRNPCYRASQCQFQL
jgi:hypothetical protein